VVKLLQVLSHLIKNILNCDVDLFHYSFVDISNDLLDNFELLEQLAPGLQDILREHILLAIHPKVRESFLRGVKNLREIAK
jgi:hypothetical protein